MLHLNVHLVVNLVAPFAEQTRPNLGRLLYEANGENWIVVLMTLETSFSIGQIVAYKGRHGRSTQTASIMGSPDHALA